MWLSDATRLGSDALARRRHGRIPLDCLGADCGRPAITASDRQGVIAKA